MYVRVVDLPGLKVGDCVFVVVTPQMHHIFSQHYRPRPYFVLETHVTAIEEGSRGPAYYFSTGFTVFPKTVFTNKEAAKAELVRRFAEETDGTLAIEKVHVVSAAEEQDGNSAIRAEISKYIAHP